MPEYWLWHFYDYHALAHIQIMDCCLGFIWFVLSPIYERQCNSVDFVWSSYRRWIFVDVEFYWYRIRCANIESIVLFIPLLRSLVWQTKLNHDFREIAVGYRKIYTRQLDHFSSFTIYALILFLFWNNITLKWNDRGWFPRIQIQIDE